MSLFVTGCESFIGRVLLRQLDQHGISATGVDLVPGSGPGRHVGDIRSPAIADLMPEGGTVVHLAALSRDADCRGRAMACFDVNVMGTLNVMDAAARRGCRQFIFASSEWVYDRFDPEVAKREEDPIDALALTSEYALSKLATEALLRQRHAGGFCDVTILRFGIIYGPRRDNWSAVESLTHAVATRDEITVGSVRTARAFVHVEDIAAGVRAAVGIPGCHTLNLQGARLVTLGDVVTIAARLTGRRPAVRESSPDTPSIRRISNSAARALLGWQPAIAIEDGIASILPALGVEAGAA
jgi:nucleoside-diphosphate-sugar epimerase